MEYKPFFEWKEHIGNCFSVSVPTICGTGFVDTAGDAKELSFEDAREVMLEAFLARKTVFLASSSKGASLFFQHCKERFILPEDSYKLTVTHTRNSGIDISDLREELQKIKLPTSSRMFMDIALPNLTLEIDFSSTFEAFGISKTQALTYKGEGYIIKMKANYEF